MTDKPFVDPTSDHYPLAQCACSHNLREHQTGKGNCVHCKCEAFVRVDEPVIVARCFPRPVVDLDVILVPLFMRPELYLGKRSLTAFRHFYEGLTLLTDDHMSPWVFEVKNELYRHGFVDWVREKHGYKDRHDMSIWDIYEDWAGGPNNTPEQTDRDAFDDFARDYEFFRQQRSETA